MSISLGEKEAFRRDTAKLACPNLKRHSKASFSYLVRTFMRICAAEAWIFGPNRLLKKFMLMPPRVLPLKATAPTRAIRIKNATDIEIMLLKYP